MTMATSPAERLAAFLIAPDAVARPAADQMPDPEAFREVVERHKVPLREAIAVNGLADDPLAASECVQHALREDEDRHRRNIELFETFRHRFDEADIPHVLVKGVWGFPYRSENIDLLIPVSAVRRADRILTQLGFIYNRFRPDRFKRLHTLISGSRWVGTLHLHKAVGWYSLFIEPDAIFRDAVDGGEPGVRLPRREVSIAIIGVHALYEDASIRLIELHKIHHLMTSGPVDWDWLWDFAVRRGFASGLALALLILDRQFVGLAGRPLFDDAARKRMESYLTRLDGTRRHWRRHIAGRDVPAYYTLSKYFVRRCLFVQVKRTRLMSLRRKLDTAAEILRAGVLHQVTRWFPQPAYLTAVCGPDGCGKTTQIERVARALEIFEVRSVRSWIRIGDSPLLAPLKRPLRRRVRAEKSVDPKTSEQGVFRSPLVRKVWPVVAIADYLLRQYAAFLAGALRERMVIADRYHVDALVDLALRCGPEILEKHWVAALMRLLPPARPAFVLKVSDETMRRRRGEEYIEGLSDRVNGYYDRAARIMGAVVLSGEGDPEAIAETITKEVLRRFFARV